MSEVILLYAFTKIDTFIALLGITALLLALLLLAALDKERPIKKLLSLFLIFLVLAVALPSKKDLAIIVGGYYAVQIASSDKAKELGGLVYEAVVKQLKEMAKPEESK